MPDQPVLAGHPLIAGLLIAVGLLELGLLGQAVAGGVVLAGYTRIDHARASTVCQSLDTQRDSLAEAEASACSPRRFPPAFLVRGNPCRMSRDANDDGLG